MFRLAPLTVLAAAALAAPALAQMRDTVYYRDRAAKPERTAEFVGAVIEENVNGIKVKPQVGPERTFPVGDLVDVVYAPPQAQVIPFQPIIAGESAVRTGAADKAKMAQLVKDYTTFLTKLTDSKTANLRRHIEYRLALLKAELADKREDQVQVVADFDRLRKELASSWQLIPAVRRQVQLMTDLGRLEDAARVVEETARTAQLSKELKQELELAHIDLMIRAGKTSEVGNRITEALAKLAPTDPMATKLKVYQIGAQAGKGEADKLAAQLKAIIDQSQDASLKALAYNTLGDTYNSKGMKKDAMWAYLWVDVVYNQDRGEHAKAVERLAGVFKDLDDDPRAEKYREKLKALR